MAFLHLIRAKWNGTQVGGNIKRTLATLGYATHTGLRPVTYIR